MKEEFEESEKITIDWENKSYTINLTGIVLSHSTVQHEVMAGIYKALGLFHGRAINDKTNVWKLMSALHDLAVRNPNERKFIKDILYGD